MMMLKHYLASPGGFFAGIGRALDLGETGVHGRAAASPADDAMALIGDWTALADDQARALDRVLANLPHHGED
jgi:hypothetical protein